MPSTVRPALPVTSKLTSFLLLRTPFGVLFFLVVMAKSRLVLVGQVIIKYIVTSYQKKRIYRYFLLDLAWEKCDNG